MRGVSFLEADMVTGDAVVVVVVTLSGRKKAREKRKAVLWAGQMFAVCRWVHGSVAPAGATCSSVGVGSSAVEPSARRGSETGVGLLGAVLELLAASNWRQLQDRSLSRGKLGRAAQGNSRTVDGKRRGGAPSSPRFEPDTLTHLPLTEPPRRTNTKGELLGIRTPPSSLE